MPDLAGTFEIGPNLNVELWQSARPADEARAPHAAARRRSRSRRSPRAIGLTFSPNLNLDIRDFAGGWNLGMLAGPLFGNRRHHQYFYGVAPEFATREPAGLRGPGRLRRLAGDRRALAPLRQRSGVGGFVRYDDLHGASFAPARWCAATAPFTAGFGISWIFATSSQRVVADD